VTREHWENGIGKKWENTEKENGKTLKTLHKSPIVA
jgi:hypothetical protein